jgi:RNA polymerase sigma-70 factor (ECF subfamily)
MRLTVNSAYDQARALSRRRVREVQLPEDAALGDGSFGSEERDSLRHAFERLTVEQRAVIVLHLHAGLPLGEIAELLRVPLGTVKSRLHYARQSMRADLRPPRLGREISEHG